MSNKTSRAASANRKADDFRIISGLPKTAKAKLHAAGILTFAQLAAMSAHEIAAAIGEEITAERILREDWIGQAGKLAASNLEQSKTAAPVPPREPEEIRTSFALELRLNEDRGVKQTRVMHVESEEKDAEETWAGWDETRLLNFLAQRGKLALRPKQEAPKHEVREPIAAPELSVEKRLSRLFAKSGVDASIISPQPPAADIEKPPATSGAQFSKKLEVLASESDIPSGLTPSGQPYCVRVSLDSKPAAGQLAYNVTVYAKNLNPATESAQHLVIGESEGVLAAAEPLACAVEGTKLSQGAYRLSAAVRFKTLGNESDAPRPFTAFVEGGLLQVY